MLGKSTFVIAIHLGRRKDFQRPLAGSSEITHLRRGRSSGRSLSFALDLRHAGVGRRRLETYCHEPMQSATAIRGEGIVVSRHSFRASSTFTGWPWVASPSVAGAIRPRAILLRSD